MDLSACLPGARVVALTSQGIAPVPFPLIRGACVNFDRKCVCSVWTKFSLAFAALTHEASCERGPRQSRYRVEKLHFAQTRRVVRVVMWIVYVSPLFTRFQYFQQLIAEVTHFVFHYFCRLIPLVLDLGDLRAHSVDPS